MRKSKFTDEQIAYALRRVETGTAATEVCRDMGVTEQTGPQVVRPIAGRRSMPAWAMPRSAGSGNSRTKTRSSSG